MKLGFRQGGTAGFGLRRVLIDAERRAERRAEDGRAKKHSNRPRGAGARPGRRSQNVRRIYQAFITEGKLESEIAARLNAQGILTDFGRAWTRGTVHQVLTNEKYIGNNVYHRTSFKLKKKHVDNPPEKWIRADGVFAGHRRTGNFLASAGNHPGAEPEIYRTRRCWKNCANC